MVVKNLQKHRNITTIDIKAESFYRLLKCQARKLGLKEVPVCMIRGGL
jgi:hypothetical protein